MSTTYRVVAGDTFELIARKTYGTEQEAGRIVRANPGALEPLAAGTSIKIPDIPGAPTDKPGAPPSDDIDETALILNAERFRFWEQVTINRSIDSMATVAFTAPFESSLPKFRDTFKPLAYTPVEVTVGGVPLFTGAMVVPLPTLEKNRKALSVSCYSAPGVLSDCNPPASLFPLEFNGFGLRDIARTIAGPFGIAVEFRHGEGAVFDQVSCEPSKKALAFLAGLAKQRNLIISDTERGALLFWQSISSSAPVARLRQGESPLVSVSPSFTLQNVYSEITGIEPTIVGLAGRSYTVSNPFLKNVIRPYTFLLSDTVNADLKQAVDAKLGRMFGDMVSYKVFVDTWRTEAGDLWAPNTVITLTAPDAMIYKEYSFIIKNVALTRDRASKSAVLDVVLPGSFSGELPGAMPWDE